MENHNHIAALRKGAAAWNAWGDGGPYPQRAGLQRHVCLRREKQLDGVGRRERTRPWRLEMRDELGNVACAVALCRSTLPRGIVT
jgi:hypothetical protein